MAESEALSPAPGAAYIEDSLAIRLRDMEQAICPVIIPDDRRLMELINQAEADTGLKLFQEQQDAVMALIKRPVALLQGGAGVGKTTVMKVLAAVWERLGGMSCWAHWPAKRRLDWLVVPAHLGNQGSAISSPG